MVLEETEGLVTVAGFEYAEAWTYIYNEGDAILGVM
jgi:hypothetical protein